VAIAAEGRESENMSDCGYESTSILTMHSTHHLNITKSIFTRLTDLHSNKRQDSLAYITRACSSKDFQRSLCYAVIWSENKIQRISTSVYVVDSKTTTAGAGLKYAKYISSPEWQGRSHCHLIQ